MPETIAFLQPLSPALKAVVDSILPDGFNMTVAQSTALPHLKELIAEAEYAVVWDIAIPGELLRAASKLKMLHKWGVGIDNLDLDTARELGVTVARTTGSNAAPVAEFTVALMLASARALINAHNGMQQGKWLKNETWRQAFMIGGKTVGIIGLGVIGKRVAKCLSGFGCDILYYKPNKIDAAEEEILEVTWAPLDELLERSDIVTLHCPLTPQTKGMIGRRELALMKPQAILLNLARGGVVAESDLIWALETGEIAGAALDVFETEPPPTDNPLLHMPNVIVTPHCAATTFDNSRKGIARMMGNFERFARGDAVPTYDIVVPPPS